MPTSRSVDVNSTLLLHVFQPGDLFDRMVAARVKGLLIAGLRRVHFGVGAAQLAFALIACSDVTKEMGRGSSRCTTLWTHKHCCHLVKVFDVEGVILVQANGHWCGVHRFGLVVQSPEACVIHSVSYDADLEEDLQLFEGCEANGLPSSFLKLCGVSLGLSLAAFGVETKVHCQAATETNEVIVLVQSVKAMLVSQPFWKLANSIVQRLCR